MVLCSEVFAVLFMLFILAFAGPAFSQLKWEKHYGYPAYTHAGYSVQQTFDLGYIVAGHADPFDEADSAQLFLVKTNASGDTLWTRTYGGNGWDEARCVRQTLDSGYIIAGSYGAYGYLVKTDASGAALWSKIYHGEHHVSFWSVEQTPDTGYILSGTTTDSSGNRGGLYLVKTNASGDTLWTRIYGNRNITGFSVQRTSDGGYVSAGYHYMVRTDASGDTLWTKSFDGVVNYFSAFCVQQTIDGGFILAGWGSGMEKACLVKTDSMGDTLWTRICGRIYSGTNRNQGYSVRQTKDSGYILAGFTSNYVGKNDKVFLVKTNASGDTLWTRAIGGIYTIIGREVEQTADGGYIIAGYSVGNGPSVYLIKTDQNGRSSDAVKGMTSSNRQHAPGPIKIIFNSSVSCITVAGHTAERFTLYDAWGRKVGTYPGSRIGLGLGDGVYLMKGQSPDSPPMMILKAK